MTESRAQELRERLMVYKLKPKLNYNSECNIRIDNFQRPWQLGAFKKYLVDSLGIQIEDENIWTNSIKTHVYVSFSACSEAKKCLEFCNGRKYPENSNLILVASFTNVRACEAQNNLEAHRLPLQYRGNIVHQAAKEEFSAIPKDKNGSKRKVTDTYDGPQTSNFTQPDRDYPFRKTTALPILFWAPVSDNIATRRKSSKE